MWTVNCKTWRRWLQVAMQLTTVCFLPLMTQKTCVEMISQVAKRRKKWCSSILDHRCFGTSLTSNYITKPKCAKTGNNSALANLAKNAPTLTVITNSTLARRMSTRITRQSSANSGTSQPLDNALMATSVSLYTKNLLTRLRLRLSQATLKLKVNSTPSSRC